MPPPREPSGPKKGRGQEAMPGGWLWLVILLVLAGLLYFTLVPGSGLIPQTELVQIAKDQLFTKVIIVGENRGIGELRKNGEEKLKEEIKKQVRVNKLATNIIGGKQGVDPLDKELKEFKGLDGKPLEVSQVDEPGTWIGPLLMLLLPGLILLAIFFFFLLPRFRDPLGGGFLGNYIKSPARRYEKGKARVTFEDVADMNAAKSELQEIVEFLRGPEKFQRLGAQIPKGVLLIGPPGTRKPLLARPLAGEAGVPFFSISRSGFIPMFVGVGARRVRDMFKTAQGKV